MPEILVRHSSKSREHEQFLRCAESLREIAALQGNIAALQVLGDLVADISGKYRTLEDAYGYPDPSAVRCGAEGFADAVASFGPD